MTAASTSTDRPHAGLLQRTTQVWRELFPSKAQRSAEAVAYAFEEWARAHERYMAAWERGNTQAMGYWDGVQRDAMLERLEAERAHAALGRPVSQ